MSAPSQAVFLSYASQDAEAARRIADALRAAGVEVWFDQSELVGGDVWDAKIRKQIAECALFVPVISANTQARREGYFRLEWKLAAQRTMTIADGEPFLLPVVIDDTRDAEAKVPAEFKAVQWTRLRAGETPPTFGARVRRLLQGETGASAPSRSTAPVAAPISRRPAWRLPVLVGSVVALAFVGGWFLRPRRVEPPAPAASKPPAPTPESEARALAVRAGHVVMNGTWSREAFDLAEGMIDKARQLDPLDGEIEALAALLDAKMVYMRLDDSEVRREKAQREAARAMTLAPASVRARWSQAFVLGNFVGTQAAAAESFQIFSALVAEIPTDWHQQTDEQHILQSDYGTLLRDQGRYEDALAIFRRNHDRGSEGWCYFIQGRPADARRVAHELVAEQRTLASLLLLGNVQIVFEEDLAAARATVERFTTAELQGEGVASLAITVALYQRDADRLLQLTQTFPRDIIACMGLIAAKSDLVGEAHALAGRTEAARVEWRRAQKVYERRLETTPNDPTMHYNRAWVLLQLGEDAEAERSARLSWSLDGGNFDKLRFDPLQIMLFWRHGRQEAVLDFLANRLKTEPGDWHIRHCMLRFLPFLDELRGNPRFEKILRDNLPPEAKPLPPSAS